MCKYLKPDLTFSAVQKKFKINFVFLFLKPLRIIKHVNTCNVIGF